MLEGRGLNAEQEKAVRTTDGPLLILAGAGAGKTKTITERIVHLVCRGVPAEKILAVTFTNKAAKEMRERIVRALNDERMLNRPLSRGALGTPAPFISTFHGLGVHILKENARVLGITRNFAIFDRSDSIRSIKEAMKQVGVDPKQFEPRRILSAISREKGTGTTAGEYEIEAGNDYFKRTLARVWRVYEQILAKENALDFDDLLLKAVRLLQADAAVRKHYQSVWSHIHVDEYQDTNDIQYEFTKLLAGEKQNICVVGDIDQTIYSWRGANIDHLLAFEETFPGAHTVILTKNYRSTKTILSAANEIIEKNANRKEKVLVTDNDDGEAIALYGGFDESDEARHVVERAQELIARGTPPQEIAVLYRANFQSRTLEEAFLYAGVPYQVLGTRFFERKEVKDTLSFLRCALNPESSSDFKRIINVPPRGIGKVTLLKILDGKEDTLPPTMREKVSNFKNLLISIKEHALTEKPSKTIKYIITASGLEKQLLTGDDEDKERLENIKELVTLASKYDGFEPREGVEKLLEDAALASDQDSLEKSTDTVKLMTVHASKGLEFDFVFITGLEDGLFPHTSDADENRDTEEERRLFYVALTRARKRVFLSYAATRMIYGSREVNVPSEFISDISSDYIEEGEEGYRDEQERSEFLIIE